uniref:Uncharacterized protein n=1 Tax=mine drainage metagenome TaxID=410659 RepID=E6PG77_9ZZZZ
MERLRGNRSRCSSCRAVTRLPASRSSPSSARSSCSITPLAPARTRSSTARRFPSASHSTAPTGLVSRSNYGRNAEPNAASDCGAKIMVFGSGRDHDERIRFPLALPRTPYYGGDFSLFGVLRYEPPHGEVTPHCHAE